MTRPIGKREVERILSADSFLDVFYFREEEHPERVFLRQPSGHTWTDYTWKRVGDEARRMAAALRAKGVRPGDRVGLISKNCAHWIIADLAILMSGAISVPYYPTLSADSLREVITASDIRVLFVGKLDGWSEQARGVPPDVKLIAFPHYAGNSRVDDAEQWDGLLQRHSPLEEPYRPVSGEPFTIIYTSGTTGSPKGVVLTYDAPRHVARIEHKNPVYGLYDGVAERLLSYLPLNHIAERVATEVTGILFASVISFSESLERFSTNLRDVEPTLFFAVPRIWTKMREAITARVPEKHLRLLLRTPVAGRALARTLRNTMGLGKARLVISGAAPLPAATLEFFWALGIPIREVYGMSETGGGVTLTGADAPSPGTVGKPLPGATIRIAEGTGEICIKAPWNMTGYFRDTEKTRQVMPNGFVHSGDSGHFDRDGNLVIAGRLNDSFKGEKGRYVIPAPIEARFAVEPVVEQVMVTGRGLPQPVALVCLTTEGRALPRAALEVRLEALRTRLNAKLDTHERLAAVVVVPAFTVENGLLTPTMKVRRHVIDARYTPQYEAWADAGKVIVTSG